jgi:hypothetical protein
MAHFGDSLLDEIASKKKYLNNLIPKMKADRAAIKATEKQKKVGMKKVDIKRMDDGIKRLDAMIVRSENALRALVAMESHTAQLCCDDEQDCPLITTIRSNLKDDYGL